MSEYQYYEFRTVDRSLTAEEIAELQKLSSRAEITTTSFTNTYSYANFRGDPDRMMEQYFDAFVYVANWGTRHFMIRLPVRGVDLPAIEAHAGGGFAFWIKGDYVILSFRYEDEGDGEWEDGQEWMPGLISLREELLNDDFRSLYLGWLSGLYGDVDDEEPEPPVPAGLRTLTASQDDLVTFLRIDRNLLEVASDRSADRAEAAPSQAQLAAWLRSQRAKDRDVWLLKLLGQSAQATRSEILLQFRQSFRAGHGESVGETTPSRTVQELREAAEARAQEAERCRAAEAAAKKAREAEQAAKLRNLELDQLARKVNAAWDDVDRKVSTKQTHQYALAVKQLIELRDLATRDKHVKQFAARLLDLARRHGKKPAFLARLREAGFTI
jgi:hypothetical protein